MKYDLFGFLLTNIFFMAFVLLAFYGSILRYHLLHNDSVDICFAIPCIQEHFAHFQILLKKRKKYIKTIRQSQRSTSPAHSAIIANPDNSVIGVELRHLRLEHPILSQEE